MANFVGRIGFYSRSIGHNSSKEDVKPLGDRDTSLEKVHRCDLSIPQWQIVGATCALRESTAIHMKATWSSLKQSQLEANSGSFELDNWKQPSPNDKLGSGDIYISLNSIQQPRHHCCLRPRLVSSGVVTIATLNDPVATRRTGDECRKRGTRSSKEHPSVDVLAVLALLESSF